MAANITFYPFALQMKDIKLSMEDISGCSDEQFIVRIYIHYVFNTEPFQLIIYFITTYFTSIQAQFKGYPFLIDHFKDLPKQTDSFGVDLGTYIFFYLFFSFIILFRF